MIQVKVDFSKSNILLLPLSGMALFVLLYIIAAINYPGGSWAFIDQNGFSFWHNYLCDLLDEYAINGELNTARFFARAALAVLCVSLILLWYHLPKLFSAKSINRTVMWLAGLLSLVITLFLASGTHDLIVRIAGFFGVIGLFTAVIELYKGHFYGLMIFGLFCLTIFFVNYYIYETSIYIEVLPLIQKITFISFIIWFVLLGVSLYRSLK
jgi:membrane-associated HD superfamily phosphohydrolase